MNRDIRVPPTKTIAIVVLPVLLFAAFALASYTPLFRVHDIRVQGAKTLSRDQVIALSGIGPGTNVFHLDTDAVAASLTADPWIAAATVQRHLPGTVEIEIQERAPVARSYVGADPVALAGDGVILPGAATDGLPEIRASVGDLADEIRTEAARAIAALDPALRARVTAVVAQPSGELEMDLAGGLTVRYGEGSEDGAKATALRAVLGWAARQGATLLDVDVSVPQAPSATLRDGSTVTP